MSSPRPPRDLPRIEILDVQPVINEGRYPVKRVVADDVEVSAVILKGGYEALRAEVQYKGPGQARLASAPLAHVYETDRWVGSFKVEKLGSYSFSIVTWTDHFGSWRSEIERKHAAGRDLSSELLEGIQLIRHAAEGASQRLARALAKYAGRIEAAPDQASAVFIALEPELARHMFDADKRTDASRSPVYSIRVDRERARFGAWYEIFPRSQSPEPGKHGTFRDLELQLPRIQRLGFDVIYLPPVHPIGHTNRKGKNNSLVAEPGDIGSPWAIGNENGGHDAIEPALGTFDDFDHLVATAHGHGIEIALDFAIQCSPDHPYVREHPEWFRRRPDGTIKYAENPPKRYEDIVALDLWCDDYPNLWAELLRVVLKWVNHGVRIFRVDNPHTKPIAFWKWLIPQVHKQSPDVIFLAEAFTRPNLLHELARIGFTQSYTYFTWRNERWEIEEYGRELAHGPGAEYLRPNFFANTPDILHEYLQEGGRPAFKIRLALAATLSPTYGIYSGYELCENTPLREGSEEYLDSEKYQLRQRDWNAPGNINDFVAMVNRVRRENPALHHLFNLHFHNPDNPNIIAYSKSTPGFENRILVVVNLDPASPQEATVHLDVEALGIAPGTIYAAHDLVTGQRFTWHGATNYVRLDPNVEPVHILRIEGR